MYKSSSSGTSIYAYDIDNVIEETNTSGSCGGTICADTNHRRTVGDAPQRRDELLPSRRHCSITSLSNAAGALANTYTYDSFGKVSASTGSLVTTGSGSATVNVTDRQTSCQRNASQPLTVVSVAIPTDWTTTSVSKLATGSLFFQYTWASSSGNKNDLSTCRVGETVFYPNYPNTPYIWPMPMVSSTQNPFSPLPYGYGSDAIAQDTNFPPDTYQAPYFGTSFNATQRFWWSCPYYNGGTQINFVPDLSITRRIFKDTDNFWKYQITKSGALGNKIKLPNQ